MPEPVAFRYLAVATNGGAEEEFTSSVEYLAGDELPLRSARWTVERVQEEGIERDGRDVFTVRTLYCEIRS